MDKRVIAGIVLLCAVILGLGVWLGSRGSRSASSTPAAEHVREETKLTDKDWVKGRAGAPLTLMEYGDFQCPACGAYYPLVERLLDEYADKVRLVYREYPLVSLHDKAYPAALAAESAGRQGKFWEMYDKLFANQETWSATADFESLFTKYAEEIGVDVGQWKKDRPDQAEKVHMHFDLAIYRDGRRQDLAADKYMEKTEAVHFHDGNGEVAHIHEKGATVGMLVDSLGVDEAGAVAMMVNGKNYEGDWRRYEPADLDRIVVMLGRPAANPAVTDKACIYSEKCPERGKPPTENCVGGLDTPCE